MRVPPLHWHPQAQLLASLCIGMFQGYKYVMGAFSLLLRGLGVFPHQLEVFCGHQHLNVHMLILVYIFVLHYVSHFYYISNYYYSGYSDIFCPVISDSGYFPDRVSSELGSAWSGSTTTLDAERLWRCYWLSFCATAANSIFDASSSLCQLCSMGRFLFQS